MDFYRRAAIVCKAIPKGKLASYGQLAMYCKAPRNARQVGFALRTGRLGEVPAHRIVNAKGELTGAGYFLLHDLQRDLLTEEGVTVRWNGRFWQADMKEYLWCPTKEEQEDFLKVFLSEGI